MSRTARLYCPLCDRSWKTVNFYLSEEQRAMAVEKNPWLSGYFYPGGTGTQLLWPELALKDESRCLCVTQRHPMYLRFREVTYVDLEEEFWLRLTCPQCGAAFRRNRDAAELLPPLCNKCLDL